MAQKTNIEWTDMSVNPFRAKNIETGNIGHFCTKPSAGCKNCYAEKMQYRFGTHLNYDVRNRDKVELFLDESKLQAVLRRKKPTKYFWCDMTDMFLEDYPFEWIDKCFSVIALTPQHTHQILTKRPERMREYMKSRSPETGWTMNTELWALINKTYEENNPKSDNGIPPEPKWPLSNCWLGVSCEDQKTADERIPILLDTPAAVRWISAEPLLGAIDLKHLHGEVVEIDCLNGTHGVLRPHSGKNNKLNQVIVGGESGSNARPCHPDWIRSLRDQCVASGTAFFFKQWGAWQPFSTSDGRQITPFGNYGVIPENHNGRTFYPNFIKAGKKAAGRILDGRTWDEYPEVKA